MPHRARKSSTIAKAVAAHDEQVGRRLRTLRHEYRMTQAELGEHLGVTFQQIGKYEAGTNTLGIYNATLIAALFEVSLASLVGDGRDGDGRLPSFNKDEYELLCRLRKLDLNFRKAILRLIKRLGGTE